MPSNVLHTVHTKLQTTATTVRSSLRDFYHHPTTEKIKKIAFTAFLALVGVALYVTNPFIFSACVLTGIFFEEQIKEGIDKINTIFHNQPWYALVAIGIGAFLSLEVTVGFAAGLFAANLGSHLARASIAKQLTSKPDTLETE